MTQKKERVALVVWSATSFIITSWSVSTDASPSSTVWSCPSRWFASRWPSCRPRPPICAPSGRCGAPPLEYPLHPFGKWILESECNSHKWIYIRKMINMFIHMHTVLDVLDAYFVHNASNTSAYNIIHMHVMVQFCMVMVR